MALPHGLVIVYTALVGLCVGSFLNVVIWRVPQDLSVRTPASHCPRCGEPLAWRHNIPLLSWLALRGRCAGCSTPISARYPLVEVACGVLFLAVVLARPGWEVVPYGVAGAGMLALTVIDLDCYRLPDKVLGPTVGLTAAAFVVGASVDGRLASLGSALAGAAIGLAALGLIHLVQPKGMGFGDVKLAALCGLILGWRGYSYVAVGLFGAFVLGALVGVALIAAGVAGRKAKLPFGPFLCASSFGVALFGAPLVAAFDRLLGG